MRRVIFSEECGENCTALTSDGAGGRARRGERTELAGLREGADESA